MKLAANTTAMTHGHLLAILSSALLAHILSRTLYGGGIGDTLNMFLREGKQFLFELFGDSMPLHMLYEKIDLAIALASNTDCDIMNIKKIGAGLDAHDALAIATYSVLRYPLDFKAAITAAANHSGNTATTAFLTGQLLGAKLGYDRISWLAKDIEVINAIVEISDDLTDECQLHRRSDGYDDPKWRSKYIDCNYTM